ncbi:MAG: hypothetical protein WCI20_00485 [bacterium]
MMTETMNAAETETRRPWGIYVIAAVYAVATFLCGVLVFIGTPAGRVFGLILVPICLILSIGIACRINLVRKILVALLFIAVVGDGLFLVFFVAAYLGVVNAPAHMSPVKQMVTIAFRIGPTIAMLYYLMRSDVRQAFVTKMPNQVSDATSEPAPSADSSSHQGSRNILIMISLLILCSYGHG